MNTAPPVCPERIDRPSKCASEASGYDVQEKSDTMGHCTSNQLIYEGGTAMLHVHPLSESDQVTNKLRSRIRVRCEHIFGRMTQMAMDRLRSIGCVRADQHIGLSNLVYNMDRYAFLCR